MQTANNNMSFYVPRLERSYNEASIMELFENMGIGSVSRVDFKVIEGNDRFQKAFIHMNYLYATEFASAIKYHVFDTGASFRINPERFNCDVYWILLANKTPVMETKLNIHQIAENARLLELRVTEQNALIATLMEKVAELENATTILLKDRLETLGLKEDNKKYTEENARICSTCELCNIRDEQYEAVAY